LAKLPPPMPPSEKARWFSQHVEPYDGALRAYLSKRFPGLPDHDDVVQETYARTWRAQESRRLTYVKAFLFTTARNAAIDLLRRRRGRTYVELRELEPLPLLDEAPSAVEMLERQQHFDVLIEAVLALPERCREVVILRYLDGLESREIAERLGIAPETVRVHLFKGVQACILFFQRRGLLEIPEPAQRAAS
jgi:RNA polymerase sigma factor (sigma-70 family)